MTILADQVLELRIRQGQVHIVRKPRIEDDEDREFRATNENCNTAGRPIRNLIETPDRNEFLRRSTVAGIGAVSPFSIGYCRSFVLSIVRSSTKRMAIGRPATAPPMPSLKCSGVQRLSAPSTALR